MSDFSQKYEAQRQEKLQAGRYTLEEAAALIELETGERADNTLKLLMEAARSGALPVYAPGKNARWRYGDGFASRVRESYEEARYNELNAWLAENEEHIKWQFPEPATEQAKSESTSNKQAAIAKRHAELKRKREKAFTARTAQEFGVSPRYVTKCVKAEAEKPPSSAGQIATELLELNQRKSGK